MAILENIMISPNKSVEVVKTKVEKTNKGIEYVTDKTQKLISEISQTKIENIESNGEVVISKINDIRNLTLDQLYDKMDENLQKNLSKIENRCDESILDVLTTEEKNKIKEQVDWDDKIIDNIGSMEEYEIYKKLGLEQAEIDYRKCLIRDDIDWNQKDIMGRSNRQRAEQGLSPLNRDGKIIELHHIGQHANSPLAELTPQEHRGKGVYNILHNKFKESEIDRQAFAREKNRYWEARISKIEVI